MVSANSILRAIERALADSANVHDALSYLVHELDADGDNTGMHYPFVEIQPRSGDNPSRTGQTPDRDPITDENGGRIGAVVRVPWTMEVVVEVHADADDPRYSARQLGQQVEDELYRFDGEVRQTPEQLPGGDGSPITEVDDFAVENLRGNDNTDSQPAIRRWITAVSVDYNRVIDTVERYGSQEYVRQVVTPKPGDFEGAGDGEVSFDAEDHFETG